MEDPVSTIAALDDWVARHRERGKSDPGPRAVSGGLSERRENLAAVEAIAVVTELANRLMDRRLPAGVSKRAATRMLLQPRRTPTT